MRTAIMSFSTWSPSLTPASKRSAMMSVNADSATRSTLMSGYSARNAESFGQRIVSIACWPAVIRKLPAGLSLNSLSADNWASIVPSAGARVEKSCSPAAVGATLRVVLVSSRTPSRASRRLMIRLSGDCNVPSRAAFSSATARKAEGYQVCEFVPLNLLSSDISSISYGRLIETNGEVYVSSQRRH